jgi:hypothetical protein
MAVHSIKGPDPEHVEDNEKGAVSSQVSDPSLQYDDAIVKRIKRKIDVRLCVVVAIMYTVCQIDRVNLPNAYVLH